MFRMFRMLYNYIMNWFEKRRIKQENIRIENGRRILENARIRMENKQIHINNLIKSSENRTLHEYTVANIKVLCTHLGIVGISGKNKDFIINKIYDKILPVEQISKKGMFDCPICYESGLKLMGLYPCGHGFCSTCVTKIKVCPICRIKVKDVIELHVDSQVSSTL